MANKTAEKISPDTFLNEMNAINNKAKDAAIDLLSKHGDKRYIVVMDWEDSYTEYYTYKAAISVSVFGVGLNEDNSLCIAATVDNQGYGCSEECFAQDWVEVSELDRPCYVLLYRFVANNIDKAVTKDEADRLAKKYWNGNGFDSGKYDWEDVFICNGFVKVKLDGKFGFINEDGVEIISCKYEDACGFSDGLARVKSEEGCGFINKDGEEITPCKYEDADAFSDGLAKVKSAEGWGFVNEHGEEIIPCKYEAADYFWFGADTAEVKLNGEWINIDKTGKQVTEEN